MAKIFLNTAGGDGRVHPRRDSFYSRDPLAIFLEKEERAHKAPPPIIPRTSFGRKLFAALKESKE